jgi:DNA repair protein RecO
VKNQIVTTGIVLSRTNYQEADRIITILTPDHGKVRVMAKGVRRPKSKLAGGIELFSESELTVLPGRGELLTLVSARMCRHFGDIVKGVDRTMMGYEFLKQINRVTEDAVEEEYYRALLGGLSGLDDLSLAVELTKLWFQMRLLDVSGHAPNLLTDAAGEKLVEAGSYLFDYDSMSFRAASEGQYDASHVRLLRVVRQLSVPSGLNRVSGAEGPLGGALAIVDAMVRVSLRG